MHTVTHLRLAATVILARPGSNGLETYMTRRSSRSAFAPDAFVFPGGTVDAPDASEAARARTLGLEPDRLAREFRAEVPRELPAGEPPVDSTGAGALSVAALRELFEEAGVLVARDARGRPVPASLVRSDAVQSQRDRLRGGELAFPDFLAAHGWFADAGALALFSHWITPPTEPRRYNTHFFLAAAPIDQHGGADAYETHDGEWIAPADALARHREGRWHLVYPTIKHLERFAAFASVEDALAFARGKPILTIMPGCAPSEGFVMPPALENAW